MNLLYGKFKVFSAQNMYRLFHIWRKIKRSIWAEPEQVSSFKKQNLYFSKFKWTKPEMVGIADGRSSGWIPVSPQSQPHGCCLRKKLNCLPNLVPTYLLQQYLRKSKINTRAISSVPVWVARHRSERIFTTWIRVEQWIHWQQWRSAVKL